MHQKLRKLKNKSVLVTGGAGFIGSHLSKALLSHGARVICFDNLSTGSKANIKNFLRNKGFFFVEGDANKLSEVENIFKQHTIDYVFHYAACVGVMRTLENPLKVLQDIDGIRNVLEMSRLHKIKKVVFSSSSEVYGEPVEIPESEDGHLNARLPYAIVKLVGEQYLKAYYEKYGLPTCSLRFFNVYGPRQESSAYGFVTGVFIRQAIQGGPLTIFGDGTQTRDFVFIDDNVTAALLTLFNEKTNGQEINIGIGRPTSILDLAERVIRMSGKKIRLEYLSRRNDILHRFPDVRKMRTLLSYEPSTSLDVGLAHTYNWYRKNAEN